MTSIGTADHVCQVLEEENKAVKISRNHTISVFAKIEYIMTIQRTASTIRALNFSSKLSWLAKKPTCKYIKFCRHNFCGLIL